MVYTSSIPDVNYPRDLGVWEWLFEDTDTSPLHRVPASQIAGFTNGLTKERLNFFQVKEFATAISTALKVRYGFEEGDTLSLFSPNTVWYPVAMFACLRIGGRVNGASPLYSVDEFTHALKVANTKYLMTVADSLPIATVAAKNAGIPAKHIFLLEGRSAGHVTLAELIESGMSYGDVQTPIWRAPGGDNNVCGFLTFSSGTTGLPKAVMLSHRNAIVQCLQLKTVDPPGKKKFLAQTPLFHISGLVRFLNWPIFNNNECIMLPNFTMDLFLRTIVEYQIEDLNLVPPLVIRLVNDPMVDQFDLSCIKRLSSSAAPLSPEIIGKLQNKFPWTSFRQSYGMTEACGCLSTHPPHLYDYKYGRTGGQLIANVVVKILDLDTGEEVDNGQAGEILAKGPNIAMGYLGNLEATAESFDEAGYLHTGDVGYIDAQGMVHIVDRIKEMIKVKGQQVAPAELEHLLLDHPAVEDCAVLGVMDEYSGERPKAYVVLNKQYRPSQKTGLEIIEHVQAQRVRYKWLKEVEFTDTIPKNGTGKILRRLLREKARSGQHGFVVSEVNRTSKI